MGFVWFLELWQVKGDDDLCAKCLHCYEACCREHSLRPGACLEHVGFDEDGDDGEEYVERHEAGTKGALDAESQDDHHDQGGD